PKIFVVRDFAPWAAARLGTGYVRPGARPNRPVGLFVQDQHVWPYASRSQDRFGTVLNAMRAALLAGSQGQQMLSGVAHLGGAPLDRVPAGVCDRRWLKRCAPQSRRGSLRQPDNVRRGNGEEPDDSPR